MNSSKLFLHAAAAFCLAAVLAFLPTAVVPQENRAFKENQPNAFP